LSQFPNELKRISKKLTAYVLFFEASDEVLQRRFSETRRPHPADVGKGLLAAIRAEKEAMQEVREKADLIIDTSNHTVHTLRRLLVEKFGQTKEGAPLHVQFLSFGHKYGAPGQVDLMFDVRHLPNPYFVKDLKELPGTNSQVVRFLEKETEVLETIKRFNDLLEYLLPLYKREGKSYLTIGIGCTGGRHRSVMIADRLAGAFKKDSYEVSVTHRDVQK
jgi:UPF0042 nucleotide-binding protein